MVNIEAKKESIVKECISFLNSSTYDPKIKQNILQLIDDVFPNPPDTLTPHFTNLILTRPKNIKIAINRRTRSGLEIFCRFQFEENFDTYKTPRADAWISNHDRNGLFIEILLHRKRSEKMVLTVSTPSTWARKPFIGNFVFEDEYSHKNGRTIRTPNKHAEFFKNILMAHIPIQFVDVIQQLEEKNTWENMKLGVGRILTMNIEKPHIPLFITIDISCNGGCHCHRKLNIFHTIK